MAKLGENKPEIFNATPEQLQAIKSIAGKVGVGDKLAQETLSEKALGLTTGYTNSPETQTDGAAVRYQQLDSVIVNTTYGSNDFTLLKQLMDSAKLTARSTVETYTSFDEHGSTGHSLFQPEIGISEISNPAMKQNVVNMKFLVGNRAESFASQIVDNVEEIDRINELDAVVTVGKSAEWAAFYGNSKLTKDTGAEGLEFDGLDNLIPKENVIDAQGTALTPDQLNKAITLIASGFGTATDAYMPVGVKADFDNQFLGAQRIAMPTPQGTVVGTDVEMFNGARGKVKLHDSTIMDMDLRLNTNRPLSPKAPNKPEFDSAVEVKNAKGTFRTDDDVKAEDKASYSERTGLTAEVNHELSYVAVAVDAKGDSMPSEVIKATPTAKDSAIKLTVKPLAGYGRADYIAFYRQDPQTKEFWLVGRVAGNTADENGKVSFVDTNKRIPGTADVFIGEFDPRVIALYELLPMTRVNLATITTATNFIVLWMGALRLSIPRRWVKISNVRYVDHAPKGSYMNAGFINGNN